MKTMISAVACVLSTLTLSAGASANEEPTLAAAGAYNIINQNSNLCLAIADGSYGEGAAVIQTTDCQSYAAQWNYVDRGNGYFTVRNNNSGLCLAIKDGSGQIGAPAIQLASCDSTATQWFPVWYQGYVRIHVRHSGLCLEVESGSAQEGARVLQTNVCSGRPAQWYFKDTRAES